MKKALIILGIVFVALGTFGSCAALLGSAATETPTSVVAPTPTTAPPKTDAPSAPKAEAPPVKVTDGIKDGMYVVGKDFPAGQYRSPGASDERFPLCMVSVKDADGDYADAASADAVDQTVMFTVTDGQTVDIDGCKPFVKL